jgi:hypothetical protein
MRDFAKVSPKFWLSDTGRKLRALGSEALVTGLYLSTSPHSNMLGLFYQPLQMIAHETGLGIEGASKGLQCCIEAGFCSYDQTSEMVWVHEMAAEQIATELSASDKRCIGLNKDYAALIENPFLGAFFDKYAGAFHLENRRGPSSPTDAPSKPHRSKEKEKEKEKNPPSGVKGGEPPASSLPGFEKFWQSWPQSSRKGAKGECAKLWRRQDLERVSGQVVAHVEAKKVTSDWTKDAGQFVEAPLVYLKQRRWEGAELGATHPANIPWADAPQSVVVARGEALGLGRWDQAAFEKGGEAFPAYKRRVRAAEVAAAAT